LTTKNTVAEAKYKLGTEGITLNAAYKMLERLRSKARKWRVGVNQVLAFRRKSKLLDYLLADKTVKGDYNVGERDAST